MKKLVLLLIFTWVTMAGCVYYPDHYAGYDSGYYPYAAGPAVELGFYYPYGYYYPRYGNRHYYPRHYYPGHRYNYSTPYRHGPYRVR